MLTEVFGSSQPPPHEESLADFVQRKFGAEVLDYLVDPLVSTIFFGNADKMGMESAFPALVEWERNQGSLVRGAIRARKTKRRTGEENQSSQYAETNPKRDTLRVTDALPSLGSFRSGMAALPERLAAELRGKIRYNATIACVEAIQNGNGTANAAWQIYLSSTERITAEHLILAVPAHVTAQLLVNASPQLSSQLKAIKYEPVGPVGSLYAPSHLANTLA